MRHTQTFVEGLVFTLLLFVAAGTLAVAQTTGEGILYPGYSPAATPSIGNPFLQVDIGVNQSVLQGRGSSSGYHNGLEGDGAVLSYMKSANGTAPNIGATIGYRFNPTFSLGLRFDYDTRFASNTGRVGGSCTDYDPESGEIVGEHPIDFIDKYETKVSYLSISAIPSLHFDGFFLYGGPSFGTPLAKTLAQNVSIDDSGSCQFFFGTDDSTKAIGGRSSGTDNLKDRIGLKFGAGYIHELNSRIGITLQAGYDLSLADIFEQDEIVVLQNEKTRSEESEIPMTVNRKLRFNSIQASIGLRINL